MKHNYRYEAKIHLAAAKSALEKGDLAGPASPADLRSAALSLRMSMECLTYSKAELYRQELPVGRIETWQPKKLMSQIIEIDPTADQSSSLSMGIQPALGKKPDVMQSMGKTKPLSLEMIKKHYDALGSYLHVPTMKKMASGEKQNLCKLRSRCQTICEEIDECLNANLWNVDFKFSATYSCSCGEKITRRIKENQKSRIVSCHKCTKRYTLSSEGERKVKWTAHETKIVCMSESCECKFYVPNHQIYVGQKIDCLDCSAVMVVGLGLVLESN